MAGPSTRRRAPLDSQRQACTGPGGRTEPRMARAQRNSMALRVQPRQPRPGDKPTGARHYMTQWRHVCGWLQKTNLSGGLRGRRASEQARQPPRGLSDLSRRNPMTPDRPTQCESTFRPRRRHTTQIVAATQRRLRPAAPRDRPTRTQSVPSPPGHHAHPHSWQPPHALSSRAAAGSAACFLEAWLV